MYSLLVERGIPYSSKEFSKMLTKQQFLAKHARKYQGLSAAEKSARYDSYKASPAAPPKGRPGVIMPVRPRASLSTGDSDFQAYKCLLSGCASSAGPLDSTPYLRVSLSTNITATVDPSGNAGLLVFPGAWGSNQAWLYNAPTFASGIVTTWGTGVVGSQPVSGLLGGRVLGVRVTPQYTGASLTATGYWASCIFSQQDSIMDSPTNSAACMLAPIHATGTALSQSTCVLPPASLEALRTWNEWNTTTKLVKKHNTPAYCWIGTGMQLNTVIRFVVDFIYEVGMADGPTTTRQLLNESAPKPGLASTIEKASAALVGAFQTYHAVGGNEAAAFLATGLVTGAMNRARSR
jgi:hypothetical protein